MRIGDSPSGLPPSGPQGSGYDVQQGDTLQSIADQHNISPQALATANQLEATAELTAGMRLVIPQEKDSPTSRGVAETPDGFEAYRPDAAWLHDSVEAMKFSAMGKGAPGKSDSVECKISLSPGETVEGKFLSPSEAVECKISLSPGETVEGKFLSPSEAVECKISLSPGETVEGKFLSPSEAVECKISLSPGETVEGKFLSPSEAVECKISLSPGETVEGKFLSPSEAVECKISLTPDAKKITEK